jgi:hypothetical protein
MIATSTPFSMSPNSNGLFHLQASVSNELPDPADELQVPIAILDHHLHQQHDTMIPQVLVRWSNLPLELSS